MNKLTEGKPINYNKMVDLEPTDIPPFCKLCNKRHDHKKYIKKEKLLNIINELLLIGKNDNQKSWKKAKRFYSNLLTE